jgi:hypothetical protein
MPWWSGAVVSAVVSSNKQTKPAANKKLRAATTLEA